MGGVQGAHSARGEIGGDEEGGLQDDDFPWFHLVQWCSKDAPAGAVFRWDIGPIQAATSALVADVGAFLAACPDKLPPACGFFMEDEMAFAEWAAALLDWSDALRHVRFRLVPSRMKEEVFWSRFFAGLRRVVRRSVFEEEGAAADQSAQPVLADKTLVLASATPAVPADLQDGASVTDADMQEKGSEGAGTKALISFTEVQQHKSASSAWVVIQGRVYDPTSFLDDHPGGRSAILHLAGGDATEDFEASHGRSAWVHLEKFFVAPLHKSEATVEGAQGASTLPSVVACSEPSSPGLLDVVGQVHSLPLVKKLRVSHDTIIFRLGLPSASSRLGLPIGKHILLTARLDGAEVKRPYTPITDDTTLGHVDLLVKVYAAGANPSFPCGGWMSQHLDSMSIGDTVDVKGPVGDFVYVGSGAFAYMGEERTCRQICFVAGGTGLTPCFQVLSAILRDPGDVTHVTLLYANRTPSDVLMRMELEALAAEHRSRFKLWLTVDHLPEDDLDWEFDMGFVNADMLQHHLDPPSPDTLVLLCGPPAFVDRACIPSLLSLGHADKNVIVF